MTFPFLLVALVGVAYVAYVIKLVVNFRAVTDEDIEDFEEVSDEDVCRRMPLSLILGLKKNISV